MIRENNYNSNWRKIQKPIWKEIGFGFSLGILEKGWVTPLIIVPLSNAQKIVKCFYSIRHNVCFGTQWKTKMAGTLTRLRNLTRLSRPLKTSSRPASGPSGAPTRTQEELSKYVEEQTKNVSKIRVFAQFKKSRQKTMKHSAFRSDLKHFDEYKQNSSIWRTFKM